MEGERTDSKSLYGEELVEYLNTPPELGGPTDQYDKNEMKYVFPAHELIKTETVES